MYGCPAMTAALWAVPVMMDRQSDRPPVPFGTELGVTVPPRPPYVIKTDHG